MRAINSGAGTCAMCTMTHINQVIIRSLIIHTLKKIWRIHDPIRRPICFDSNFFCNEVSASAAGCLSVVCLSLWWCVAITPMSVYVFTTLLLLKRRILQNCSMFAIRSCVQDFQLLVSLCKESIWHRQLELCNPVQCCRSDRLSLQHVKSTSRRC